MDTYKIVRFFKDGRASEDRQEGLILAEAQAHCKREDTHGEDFFDGYTQE